MLKQNRSFMISLGLMVVSGVTVGLMASGTTKLRQPPQTGPATAAPQPVATDTSGSGSVVAPDSSMTASTGSSYTPTGPETVPADVPASTKDTTLTEPR